MNGSPFLSHVRDYMLTRRYARLTIKTYIYWIKFFINFHNKQHPETLNDGDVESFLTFLAAQRNVAANTQSQALNALVFLYREIIHRPLALTMRYEKSRQQRKLPVVLTQEEVKQLLLHIHSSHKLQAQLMYGSGLRLMEALRLRVQDIDFDYHTLSIWHGKGGETQACDPGARTGA